VLLETRGEAHSHPVFMRVLQARLHLALLGILFLLIDQAIFRSMVRPSPEECVCGGGEEEELVRYVALYCSASYCDILRCLVLYYIVHC
jgi:hypothetical protein